jgi:hypothetical protein
MYKKLFISIVKPKIFFHPYNYYIDIIYRLNIYIYIYLFIDRKWEINDLTYNIIKYPKQLDKSVIDSEIRRAFDLWSEVTPLRFTHKKSGKVRLK